MLTSRFEHLRGKHQNKKSRKGKRAPAFQGIETFSLQKQKRVSQAWPKAQKMEKSCPPALNKKQTQTNYLLHV